MARRWLDPERVAWLRREYPKHTVERTRERFNRRFGTAITYGQLHAAASNHRFGRARRQRSTIFDRDEQDWLDARLPKAPLHDVRVAFGEAFDWRPPVVSLRNYRQRHGLRGAPNTGRFRKGQARTPGSGAKGAGPTSFTAGNVPANKRPLWSERWSMKHGRRQHLEMNVPETNPHTGYGNRWIRKAVWVWRQANGPAPEGMCVVQLDGDPANCELSNLACVTRSALARMNAPHAPGYAGREANPARVRRAQLLDAISRRIES